VMRCAPSDWCAPASGGPRVAALGRVRVDHQCHRLLFYDESLTHRLTKRVRNTAGAQMRKILNQADRVRAAISDDRYDFDAAKADVMRKTRL